MAALETFMRPLPRERYSLFFDKETEPVFAVSSGQVFTIYTPDCACGLIRSGGDLISSADELLAELGGLNFLVGPVRINGARPGDTLRVTLLDVEPAPLDHQGFTALVPGFGALVHDNGFGVQDSLPPATTICTVNRDRVLVPLGDLAAELPCRPLVGCIGVAPTRERRMTLSQSPDYVGDIDIPDFTIGSVLHVRANHDGGLLSLGDVHAVQGDGELTGMAVEVPALITLKVDVIAKERSSLRRLPLLTDCERVGVVAAFQGTSTARCIQAAGVELVHLLAACGMTRETALQYLSVAARVRIGNAFEPFYSVYMYLERATSPVELSADLQHEGR